ncbi:diaminopimelate epimerase [candidate division KSB1 bacterium]|nr:diaminopimelate epimerase [candidate division KSB1 bacterium]
MKFYKYHGLGNDYIVMDPAEIGRELSADEMVLICHPHFGVGSDGILWGPLKTEKADFRLRIFNPDGSEAEKSGNGLRIFSRYLYDRKMVTEKPFSIDTLGGLVRALVQQGGRLVQVEMGKVSFSSRFIPVAGPERDVLNEQIKVKDRKFTFCAATIGNPHCVIPCNQVSAELAKTYGPDIEVDPRFPHRTNVQFLQVIDRQNIRIEIWERGAGYTLASGSSSSAAAAVARKLGMCDRNIRVHMPGGVIEITVDENFEILMSGPVTRIAEGVLDPESFEYGRLAKKQ